MSRRWRAAGVVVVLAMCVASAEAGTDSIPTKLVGAWTRNVTAANWKKFGETGYPAGFWTLDIKKGGGLDVYAAGGHRPGCIAKETCLADFTTSVAVNGTRLTVAKVPVCLTKGQYRWSVTGTSLTLKLIADKQCGPREALFSGVWKRTRR